MLPDDTIIVKHRVERKSAAMSTPLETVRTQGKNESVSFCPGDAG